MMTMSRINDPQPLVFIPDFRFGEADGKPFLLDLFASRAMGRQAASGHDLSP